MPSPLPPLCLRHPPSSLSPHLPGECVSYQCPDGGYGEVYISQDRLSLSIFERGVLLRQHTVPPASGRILACFWGALSWGPASATGGPRHPASPAPSASPVDPGPGLWIVCQHSVHAYVPGREEFLRSALDFRVSRAWILRQRATPALDQGDVLLLERHLPGSTACLQAGSAPGEVPGGPCGHLACRAPTDGALYFSLDHPLARPVPVDLPQGSRLWRILHVHDSGLSQPPGAGYCPVVVGVGLGPRRRGVADADFQLGLWTWSARVDGAAAATAAAAAAAAAAGIAGHPDLSQLDMLEASIQDLFVDVAGPGSPGAGAGADARAGSPGWRPGRPVALRSPVRSPGRAAGRLSPGPGLLPLQSPRSPVGGSPLARHPAGTVPAPPRAALLRSPLHQSPREGGGAPSPPLGPGHPAGHSPSGAFGHPAPASEASSLGSDFWSFVPGPHQPTVSLQLVRFLPPLSRADTGLLPRALLGALEPGSCLSTAAGPATALRCDVAHDSLGWPVVFIHLPETRALLCTYLVPPRESAPVRLDSHLPSAWRVRQRAQLDGVLDFLCIGHTGLRPAVGAPPLVPPVSGLSLDDDPEEEDPEEPPTGARAPGHSPPGGDPATGRSSPVGAAAATAAAGAPSGSARDPLPQTGPGAGAAATSATPPAGVTTARAIPPPALLRDLLVLLDSGSGAASLYVSLCLSETLLPVRLPAAPADSPLAGAYSTPGPAAEATDAATPPTSPTSPASAGPASAGLLRKSLFRADARFWPRLSVGGRVVLRPAAGADLCEIHLPEAIRPREPALAAALDLAKAVLPARAWFHAVALMSQFEQGAHREALAAGTGGAWRALLLSLWAACHPDPGPGFHLRTRPTPCFQARARAVSPETFLTGGLSPSHPAEGAFGARVHALVLPSSGAFDSRPVEAGIALGRLLQALGLLYEELRLDPLGARAAGALADQVLGPMCFALRLKRWLARYGLSGWLDRRLSDPALPLLCLLPPWWSVAAGDPAAPRLGHLHPPDLMQTVVRSLARGCEGALERGIPPAGWDRSLTADLLHAGHLPRVRFVLALFRPLAGWTAKLAAIGPNVSSAPGAGASPGDDPRGRLLGVVARLDPDGALLDSLPAGLRLLPLLALAQVGRALGGPAGPTPPPGEGAPLSPAYWPAQVHLLAGRRDLAHMSPAGVWRLRPDTGGPCHPEPGRAASDHEAADMAPGTTITPTMAGTPAGRALRQVQRILRSEGGIRLPALIFEALKLAASPVVDTALPYPPEELMEYARDLVDQLVFRAWALPLGRAALGFRSVRAGGCARTAPGPGSTLAAGAHPLVASALAARLVDPYADPDQVPFALPTLVFTLVACPRAAGNSRAPPAAQAWLAAAAAAGRGIPGGLDPGEDDADSDNEDDSPFLPHAVVRSIAAPGPDAGHPSAAVAPGRAARASRRARMDALLEASARPDVTSVPAPRRGPAVAAAATAAAAAIANITAGSRTLLPLSATTALSPWCSFHNACAASLGLVTRVAPSNAWIMANLPADPYARGGYLFGLGLRGMLQSFQRTPVHHLLSHAHSGTISGLLLGLAASPLAAGQMALPPRFVLDMLYLHVPALLPASLAAATEGTAGRGSLSAAAAAADLLVAPTVQSAAIVGIGLSFCRWRGEGFLPESLYHRRSYHLDQAGPAARRAAGGASQPHSPAAGSPPPGMAAAWPDDCVTANATTPAEMEAAAAAAAADPRLALMTEVPLLTEALLSELAAAPAYGEQLAALSGGSAASLADGAGGGAPTQEQLAADPTVADLRWPHAADLYATSCAVALGLVHLGRGTHAGLDITLGSALSPDLVRLHRAQSRAHDRAPASGPPEDGAPRTGAPGAGARMAAAAAAAAAAFPSPGSAPLSEHDGDTFHSAWSLAPHVTAPAAALALGLIHLDTGDPTVAGVLGFRPHAGAPDGEVREVPGPASGAAARHARLRARLADFLGSERSHGELTARLLCREMTRLRLVGQAPGPGAGISPGPSPGEAAMLAAMRAAGVPTAGPAPGPAAGIARYVLDFVPDWLLVGVPAGDLTAWDACTAEALAGPATDPARLSLRDIDTSPFYFGTLAAAALALGLRFAGAGFGDFGAGDDTPATGADGPLRPADSPQLHQLDATLSALWAHAWKVSTRPMNKPTDRWYRTAAEAYCANVLLAAGLVFAGTGASKWVARARLMRSRVRYPEPLIGWATFSLGSPHDDVYAYQCAVHLALGFLFLGGSAFSFASSPFAKAMLLLAVYPRWPMHSSSDAYSPHPQWLRHLWAMAAESRLLSARRVPDDPAVDPLVHGAAVDQADPAGLGAPRRVRIEVTVNDCAHRLAERPLPAALRPSPSLELSDAMAQMPSPSNSDLSPAEDTGILDIDGGEAAGAGAGAAGPIGRCPTCRPPTSGNGAPAATAACARRYQLTTPCLLPDASVIQRLAVVDPDYLPVTLEPRRFRHHARLLRHVHTIFVQARAPAPGLATSPALAPGIGPCAPGLEAVPLGMALPLTLGLAPTLERAPLAGQPRLLGALVDLLHDLARAAGVLHGESRAGRPLSTRDPIPLQLLRETARRVGHSPLLHPRAPAARRAPAPGTWRAGRPLPRADTQQPEALTAGDLLALEEWYLQLTEQLGT
ncbi:hypothetical protein H696_02724 [Fonticula alba]|uniref:Uncharacterized protein n=1 Tax=Fonticula alba TaxID=691883 RepID=A0A058Z8Y3_FONAL|nr:hypothetical protein H696_02724 [Fonticula alba]KCV70388.1 hypothetical protein H696_02724 [Fonticula alba]|eukprot:XP_009494904.1 hypothetical protein H696_02724 [Fonticula alba]